MILTQCTLDSTAVTEFNGTDISEPLPYSPTLVTGSNTATVTNTVTCTSRLTLAKLVEGGDGDDDPAPTDWTLDAVAPRGAPRPQWCHRVAGGDRGGHAGCGLPLNESGGDPNYAQSTEPNAVPIPGSTTSWSCVELAADGTTVIPGFSDGLNGGVNVPFGRWIRCTAVNQTATLELRKVVENSYGGTAEPEDWSITATPTGTFLPDSSRRPSRAPRPAPRSTCGPAWRTRSRSRGHLWAMCSRTPAASPTRVDRSTGRRSPSRRWTRRRTFTNADTPARLTLVKEVEAGTTRATEVPASWTLTASPDGIVGQGEVSGNGDPTSAGGIAQVEVFAGTYDLAESVIAGYTAGPGAVPGRRSPAPPCRSSRGRT